MSNPYLNDVYNSICVSASGGLIERFLHRSIERKHDKKEFWKVLEIGAHNAEHLQYVVHEWHEYHMVDLIEMPEPIKDNLPKGAFFHLTDGVSLPFPSDYFDRIVITCVLHHVENLVALIAEIKRTLNKSGSISILLPCDPGLMYRLSKEITTGSKARFARKYQDLKLFHAKEHRNHFWSLRILLKDYFNDKEFRVKIHYVPFRIRSWNLNLFTTWHIERITIKN